MAIKYLVLFGMISLAIPQNGMAYDACSPIVEGSAPLDELQNSLTSIEALYDPCHPSSVANYGQVQKCLQTELSASHWPENFQTAVRDRCLARLESMPALSFAISAAEMHLQQLDERLQTLRLQLALGVPLSSTDLRLLAYAKDELGLTTRFTEDAKALRNPLQQAATQVNVKFSEKGLDFSNFSFDEAQKEKTPEALFLSEYYGDDLSQALSRKEAIVIGHQVYVPQTKRLWPLLEYERKVSELSKEFTDSLKQAVNEVRKYDSWSSSIKRIIQAGKEVYLRKPATGDPHLEAANPFYVKTMSSYQILARDMGLGSNQKEMLKEMLILSGQEERAALNGGTAKVEGLIKAYYGTLAATATVATGGFAAGAIWGGATTQMVVTGATRALVTAAVTNQAIGATKVLVSGTHSGDRLCRLRDSILENGLASLASAPLAATIGMLLPPGIGQLSKLNSRLFELSSQTATRVATIETGVALATPGLIKAIGEDEGQQDLEQQIKAAEENGQISLAGQLRGLKRERLIDRYSDLSLSALPFFSARLSRSTTGRPSNHSPQDVRTKSPALEPAVRSVSVTPIALSTTAPLVPAAIPAPVSLSKPFELPAVEIRPATQKPRIIPPPPATPRRVVARTPVSTRPIAKTTPVPAAPSPPQWRTPLTEGPLTQAIQMRSQKIEHPSTQNCQGCPSKLELAPGTGHSEIHFWSSNPPRVAEKRSDWLKRRGRYGKLTSLFPAGTTPNDVLSAFAKRPSRGRLVGSEVEYQSKLSLRYVTEDGREATGLFEVVIRACAKNCGPEGIGRITTIFPRSGPSLTQINYAK